MEAIKLSINDLLIRWANICVDWFMNLFADPDYYWVEETYPKKQVATNMQAFTNEKCKESVVRTYDSLNIPTKTKDLISNIFNSTSLKTIYSYLFQSIHKVETKYIAFNI